MKGNLGQARPTGDGAKGTTNVLHAQEEKKDRNELALVQKVLEVIWEKKYKAKNDAQGFWKDKEVVKLKPRYDRAKEKVGDISTGKGRIPDLVGTFGPEKLSK